MNLRRNASLKILAVFLAFVAWVWVESQGDLLKTVVVPVEITGLPGDLELMGDPPDVSLRLRGPELSLTNLAPERVRLTVDVSRQQLQPGTNVVPVDPTRVRLPAGIEVDRVMPPALELDLERVATREVPVEPAIQGLPAPGFELAGSVVTPPRVVIEGPESSVKEVESVSTATISIEGASQNQRMEVIPVPIGPPGGQVRLADPSRRVEVLVRIRPMQAQRVINGVALAPLGLESSDIRPVFIPAAVAVQATGSPPRVEDVAAEFLQVMVDLTDARPGQPLRVPAGNLIIRVRGNAPEGMTELSFSVVSPPDIEVSWERGPQP